MKQLIRKKKTWSLMALLLVLQLTFATNLPVNYYYQPALLQKQLTRFTEIQQKGGWPKLTLTKKQYKEGETAPFVKQLKERLKITGEFTSADTTGWYTVELANAVRQVQRQFGLKETGITDALVVSALNVPASKRVQQLSANLRRSQNLPSAVQGRYIIVNIPEYKLHIYEDTRHVMEMNVVVGSEKDRTAVLNDQLTHIVFSPYWNVPESIVRNEILPAMRRNRNYLSANGYEKTGTENGLPKIRQKPGENNSLGLVKFLFPNEHAIYFHDSPAKTLFTHRIRAYSHGCVRLAEPERLAQYLLNTDPAWDVFKISEAMYAGKEQWVKLAQPVAVFIIYLTAWVDENGALNFRDDIYNMDEETPVASAGTFSKKTA